VQQVSLELIALGEMEAGKSRKEYKHAVHEFFNIN
jgi:hypothetical protein